mmetsp:Transcript_26685/g.85656  ORF Transcript_26685/g.85656 Transcript_26685/m.85656 type:complete len:786 (-) Transcript_26685:152-2509(-)
MARAALAVVLVAIAVMNAAEAQWAPSCKAGTHVTVDPCHTFSFSSSSHGEFAASVELPAIESFTIMFWTKTTATGISQTPVSISAPGPAAAIDALVVGRSACGDDVSIMDAQTFSNVYDNGNTGARDLCADGEWHHMAIVRDFENGRVYSYFDGKLKRSFTESTSGSKGIAIPAGGVLVGGQEQDCVGGCFDGQAYGPGLLGGIELHGVTWSRYQIENGYNWGCRPSAGLLVSMASLTRSRGLSLGSGPEECTPAEPCVTPAMERAALLEFKAALTEENLVAEWGTDPDTTASACCFRGITCDLVGRINRIDIANFKAEGPLSPAFSGIKALTYLSMSGNLLTGTAPSEFSTLTKLKRLELNHVRISGPLQAAWSVLHALEILKMESSGVTGDLPASWSSLKSLMYLVIGNNRFTNKLRPEWSTMAKLKQLTITNANLDQGGLPTEYSMFTDMIYMNLLGNNITGPVPTSWSHLGKLISLHLRDNRLGPDAPAWCLSHPTIQSITLSRNSFTGPFSSLGPATSPTLRVLYLSYNAWTGPLPATWAGLPALQQLVVETTDTEGPVPSEWSALTDLRMLRLSHNPKLEGPLPGEALGEMSSLQTLFIQGCPSLDGPLPPALSKLAALEQLHLVLNAHTGTLPASYSALRALKYMRLSHNSLSGTAPAEWSELDGIVDMDLRSNDLSGPLRPEWSALRNLARFCASNNAMTSTLPIALSELSHLTELNLADNKFTGGRLVDRCLLAIAFTRGTLCPFSRDYLSISRDYLSIFSRKMSTPQPISHWHLI